MISRHRSRERSVLNDQLGGSCMSTQLRDNQVDDTIIICIADASFSILSFSFPNHPLSGLLLLLVAQQLDAKVEVQSQSQRHSSSRSHSSSSPTWLDRLLSGTACESTPLSLSSSSFLSFVIITMIIVIIQTKSIHERDPLFTDFVTSIPSSGTGNLYNR